jgi:hypothetical protein
MDFFKELQKPSIQCQLAKPNAKLSGRAELAGLYLKHVI